MIWQERVTTIVMVTNLKEGEKVCLVLAYLYTQKKPESVPHFMFENTFLSRIYTLIKGLHINGKS